MVRKEKVTITKTKKSSQGGPFAEDVLNNFRAGMQENRKTLLGAFLLIIGVIQLREFIVGIVLVTFGVLFIAGFFDKTK